MEKEPPTTPAQGELRDTTTLGPFHYVPPASGGTSPGAIFDDSGDLITRNDSTDEVGHLLAAAPDLRQVVAAQAVIISKAQMILSRYLSPPGTADEALSDLLLLLDGPEERRVLALQTAAIAKADGRAAS